MEILGNDDEADEAAWERPGRSAPARTPGPAGYARDTGVDRTGIPARPAAPPPAPAELDLGEQALDLGRPGSDVRHAGAPPTGGFLAPGPPRTAAEGPAPDPRPGLRDPGPAAAPAPVPAPEPEPEPEPQSLRDLVLGTVLSAESLGLSGLVLVFFAISSTVPSVIAFSDPNASGAGDQLRAYAYAYGITGLIAVVLGVVAITRLRPTGGSAAGRGLSGAAVVVGVLLGLLAAYLAVVAGDFPPEPTGDFS